MSIQPRRSNEQRNADARRALMAAALELIAEKGFERTTAAEIGLRAGYSRSIVRDHYGSKDGLLVALCDQEFEERLLPSISRDREGSGLELMLGLLDDMLVVVRTVPEQFRAVTVLGFEAPGPIPSIRGWWAGVIERYEETLGEHLRAGQDDGSIRPGIDCAREAEIFVSYGTGLCYRWAILYPDYDLAGEITAWRGRLERHLRA